MKIFSLIGNPIQVVVYVTWTDIEALAAKLGKPGEIVIPISVVHAETKPASLGELFTKREERLGIPITSFSLKEWHLARLRFEEYQQLLDLRSPLKEVRRPWPGNFELLPFSDPDATKVVARPEDAWREIMHEGVFYRSTMAEHSDYLYSQVSDLVC